MVTDLRCRQHEHCYRLTRACHHASVSEMWACRACFKAHKPCIGCGWEDVEPRP